MIEWMYKNEELDMPYNEVGGYLVIMNRKR